MASSQQLLTLARVRVAAARQTFHLVQGSRNSRLYLDASRNEGLTIELDADVEIRRPGCRFDQRQALHIAQSGNEPSAKLLRQPLACPDLAGGDQRRYTNRERRGCR